MESEDYKKLVDKLFGENQDKDAVVIDIRYNTGGNIHDQFIDLLSGVNYGEAVSRDGYKAANFPLRRWTKPTILLANPSSYSDASVVAKLYQDNKLGKLVGDVVPGTGTFVNWQTQQELYWNTVFLNSASKTVKASGLRTRISPLMYWCTTTQRALLEIGMCN